MTHLDASVLIPALMPGTSHEAWLRARLRAGEVVGVSSPAWAEFLCGPVAGGQLRLAGRLLGVPQPLDAEAAATAADLFDRAGRRRGSIVDCMIAAVAMQADAALATANVTDFSRFVPFGLRLADS